VFDNGELVTGIDGWTAFEESFVERSKSIPPVPLGIDEPGIHTITATLTGSSECAAGSKLVSLDLVATQAG
jgi:hypothetical protein